jgi:hypothetical protein
MTKVAAQMRVGRLLQAGWYEAAVDVCATGGACTCIDVLDGAQRVARKGTSETPTPVPITLLGTTLLMRKCMSG